MIQYDSTRPSTINWNMVLLIATGVIALITLITVFFVIPKVVEENLNNRVQKGLDGLNTNLGIAVGEPNPNGYECTKDIYNCGNFTTRAQAQVAFDFCFKKYGDVYGLDGDGNGKACESLR